MTRSSSKARLVNASLAFAAAAQPDASQLAPMYYVVHAWSDSFGSLVASVREHYERLIWGGMDPVLAKQYKGVSQNYRADKHNEWYALGQLQVYYWLDILAVNQHQGDQGDGQLDKEFAGEG
jgi:hypothetical protein